MSYYSTFQLIDNIVTHCVQYPPVFTDSVKLFQFHYSIVYYLTVSFYFSFFKKISFLAQDSKVSLVVSIASLCNYLHYCCNVLMEGTSLPTGIPLPCELTYNSVLKVPQYTMSTTMIPRENAGNRSYRFSKKIYVFCIFQ